jgi:hypothetical protein
LSNLEEETQSVSYLDEIRQVRSTAYASLPESIQRTYDALSIEGREYLASGSLAQDAEESYEHITSYLLARIYARDDATHQVVLVDGFPTDPQAWETYKKQRQLGYLDDAISHTFLIFLSPPKDVCWSWYEKKLDDEVDRKKAFAEFIKEWDAYDPSLPGYIRLFHSKNERTKVIAISDEGFEDLPVMIQELRDGFNRRPRGKPLVEAIDRFADKPDPLKAIQVACEEKEGEKGEEVTQNNSKPDL